MSLIKKYNGPTDFLDDCLRKDPTNEKYELTDITKEYEGHTLYRIRALRDIHFSTGLVLRAGSLGGWVESEVNLSNLGECWVHHDAMVMGEAMVFDDSLVLHDSIVKDSTSINGRARVQGKSKITEDAVVYDDSVVENSYVFDYAIIAGNARVLNGSYIFGHGEVRDHAIIEGGTVTDRAIASGTCLVKENGVLSQHQHVCSGHVVSDISEDLSESIRLQTGLIPFDSKVIAYKQVCKGENGLFCSMHDQDFVYEIGKVAEALWPNTDPELSCAAGLHFSNANYWNDSSMDYARADRLRRGKDPDDASVKVTSFLVAEIRLDDILAVQEGKIRCRRAKIIGSYDIK